MTDEFKQKLRDNGVAVDETISRFMDSEEIYEKFLFKFVKDNDYCELKDVFAKQSYEQAMHPAHKLKGVTANLGLVPVQKILEKLVYKLRNQEYDEQMQQLYLDFCERYEEIVGLIRSFQ